jgi:hypothetical protein
LKCGSVLEKAEGTEKTEPQDKIMTVSELSAWFGLKADGGKVFEVTDWKKQLASTTRRRIMRILFGYEEIIIIIIIIISRRFVSLDFSARFLQVIFEESCKAACSWSINSPDGPSPTSHEKRLLLKLLFVTSYLL